MATIVYSVPGFPRIKLDENGEQFLIGPMLPSDADSLLEFFERIPAKDRFYLKEDVTSPEVIAQWIMNMDYRRTMPLLAIKDDRIIGDGTLHHRRAGARKHIGEVRVVVDPEYRNQGVGRALLRELVEVARDRNLERLIFEVVADEEEAAKHTAGVIGFKPLAILPGYIKDYDGGCHDLIIMEMPLITTDQVHQEYAPGRRARSARR